MSSSPHAHRNLIFRKRLVSSVPQDSHDVVDDLPLHTKQQTLSDIQAYSSDKNYSSDYILSAESYHTEITLASSTSSSTSSFSAAPPLTPTTHFPSSHYRDDGDNNDILFLDRRYHYHYSQTRPQRKEHDHMDKTDDLSILEVLLLPSLEHPQQQQHYVKENASPYASPCWNMLAARFSSKSFEL